MGGKEEEKRYGRDVKDERERMREKVYKVYKCIK